MEKPALRYATGPWRTFAFPLLAVGATLALPFYSIMGVYLVVGHAHFLMAYLYQYRGKRMNVRYLFLAGILAVSAVLYGILVGSPVPIFIVAGILFALHFAIDEFTLAGEAFTARAWVAIVGFTLLFSAFVVIVALPESTLAPSLAAFIILGTVVVRALFSRALPSRAERYLLFVAVLLYIVAVPLHRAASVLGVILLLHFANWYIGYGVRLAARPERARTYWREVAITLALCAGVFALSLTSAGHVLSSIFFGFAPYYAWAIAHILLSFVTAIPVKKPYQ